MSRILLCAGASVALYKSCDLASNLAQAGHEVRTVLTPARRKAAAIAASRRAPMPRCLASGRTSIANTQPHGGEPNSQSRTSPMMNPRTKNTVKWIVLALPSEVLASLQADTPFVFRHLLQAIRRTESKEEAQAYRDLLNERLNQPLPAFPL